APELVFSEQPDHGACCNAFICFWHTLTVDGSAAFPPASEGKAEVPNPIEALLGVTLGPRQCVKNQGSKLSGPRPFSQAVYLDLPHRRRDEVLQRLRGASRGPVLAVWCPPRVWPVARQLASLDRKSG